MGDTATTTLQGGCSCGQVRYQLDGAPIIVHACHCHWCQRETGTAFALNALIESDRVRLQQGKVETVPVPSHSGKGQRIVRCEHCHVALWSHYPGGGDAISFVRVGTLDASGALPPDVHIYTDSKLPWLPLPDGARAFDGFYDPKVEWSADALKRYRATRPGAAG